MRGDSNGITEKLRTIRNSVVLWPTFQFSLSIMQKDLSLDSLWGLFRSLNAWGPVGIVLTPTYVGYAMG